MCSITAASWDESSACQRSTGAALMPWNWSENIEFSGRLGARPGWRYQGRVPIDLQKSGQPAQGGYWRLGQVLVTQNEVAPLAKAPDVLHPGEGRAPPIGGEEFRLPVRVFAPVRDVVIAWIAQDVNATRPRATR